MMSTVRICSKKVVERQPKIGGWLTILECGHDRFVRHFRAHHICPDCQREKGIIRASTHQWVLQTQSGLVLVKGRMFKPFAHASFSELERYPTKVIALSNTSRLKLSYQLIAVKLQVVDSKELA